MTNHLVAVNWWWCTEHLTMHSGQIYDFNMDHRTTLHPVYIDFNKDRVNIK